MAADTTLREITKETVREITRLDVGPDQQGLVAPNSVSIAEAYFEPKAWFRAIYSGEEPAGFRDGLARPGGGPLLHLALHGRRRLPGEGRRAPCTGATRRRGFGGRRRRSDIERRPGRELRPRLLPELRVRAYGRRSRRRAGAQARARRPRVRHGIGLAERVLERVHDDAG